MPIPLERPRPHTSGLVRRRALEKETGLQLSEAHLKPATPLPVHITNSLRHLYADVNGRGAVTRGSQTSREVAPVERCCLIVGYRLQNGSSY